MHNKIYITGKLKDYPGSKKFTDINFNDYAVSQLIPLVDTFSKAELHEFYRKACDTYYEEIVPEVYSNDLSFGEILWDSNNVMKHLAIKAKKDASIVISQENITNDIVLFDKFDTAEKNIQVDGSFEIGVAIDKYNGKIIINGQTNDIINRKLIRMIAKLGFGGHFTNAFAITFTLTTDGEKTITVHDIKFGFTINLIDTIESSNSIFFTKGDI